MHIYYERCNKIIKTLNRGEFFGELAFFSNRSRTAGAKSYNFSSVFKLKRENFLTLVQDFQTDKVANQGIGKVSHCLFVRKRFITFKTISFLKRTLMS